MPTPNLNNHRLSVAQAALFSCWLRWLIDPSLNWLNQLISGWFNGSGSIFLGAYIRSACSLLALSSVFSTIEGKNCLATPQILRSYFFQTASKPALDIFTSLVFTAILLVYNLALQASTSSIFFAYAALIQISLQLQDRFSVAPLPPIQTAIPALPSTAVRPAATAHVGGKTVNPINLFAPKPLLKRISTACQRILTFYRQPL